MREPTATSIPIEELQYGIRRAVIGDQALLASATFILEVSADMEVDTLMKAFRAQSKFGPQDKIRQLVVQALPSIPIRARMNAPRQLPYHVNAVYFEIDTGHDLWKGIEQTGILTLHIAGTFPNLAMTLWALKR
jgi:type VI secretion system protein ImpJ